MTLREVDLDDKYTKTSGRILLTGIQALVRLPMMQQQSDGRRGFTTAGYVTGYRGSPLGNYDQQLAQARRFLDAHRIKVQPGVNEDLAATALWGTQQANLHGEGRYDGVFGIWYGKGPGVDRSGDALRHANLAGTAPLGGVLVLMGDDHTCESSTTAHQSEYAMVDAMIPIINPSGVAELLSFGMIGFSLSRYSGCWIGLKCVHDTVNTAATVDLDTIEPRIVVPGDHEMPDGGLNIRWPDPPLAQEARLHRHRHEAVKAFARANALDRVIVDPPKARLGIIAAGKSYLDLRQALDDLGIDDDASHRLGIRVLKLGLTYPIARETIETFARGLKQILVVEEKRGLIESQAKEILYGRRDAPVIIGKRDQVGDWLLPSHGALSSNRVAEVVGRQVLALDASDQVASRLADLEARDRTGAAIENLALRMPYFCSGCPHNTSTRVPNGSVARAGIGCHYMAQWMDRATTGYTQMGGEGASWIGEAPFSTRSHVFQNIGDGTYYHSGLLAIRAAIAAGVNITFKILYNDAVAMTGGQPVDGPLTVPQITRQLAAEGVIQIAVVSEAPDSYPLHAGFAPGTTLRHRDDLDQVQRELREIEGTTALVYDQTCAAEKRRRRKRGLMHEPATRVMINEAVCEGCGDCGTASNCVSILPVETEFGRKRQIDQSSCNKDFSCLNGFCPSFVTLEGARPEKPARLAFLDTLEKGQLDLPEPPQPPLERSYNIIIAGIGGTGVVTIGALLAMAAHLEHKAAAVLDMTGLAQKGGAVTSHLRIAMNPSGIQTARIAPGGAQLLLGCDLVVAAGRPVLGTVSSENGHAILNDHDAITGDFTRQADLVSHNARLRQVVKSITGARAAFVSATRLATALLGDAMGTNLFMVGYASQKGLLPLAAESIERAIDLNGVAVAMNCAAFRLGRLAAYDPARVTAALDTLLPAGASRAGTLDEVIQRRVAYLRAYQDAAYAKRYIDLVEKIRTCEAEAAGGLRGLTEAVARCYFKLLAYKDEYEVARLYTEGDFAHRLKNEIGPRGKVRVYLAPPLLALRDPVTGMPRKKAYGPWIFGVFRLLAGLKRLRGTTFDPFAYSHDRRLERELILRYEASLAEIMAKLSPENHGVAVQIASLPEQIRGFGHVKAGRAAAAKKKEAELFAAFKAPSPALHAAE